jgi:HD superfamily phosphohydrolase
MHNFRGPANLSVATGNDPLLMELVETPAFQRLKEIRFLGAIDYSRIPRPNGRPRATRYSRYQHSLGVMELALQYCRKRRISFPERRLACTAALLHDIGHPPLSHSVESVFKEEFGIDHHTASEDIICGRVPLGKDVLVTLRHHGVDVEELVAVVSGETMGFDGFFHGPINFDTIEGILRSYAYIQQSSTSLRPDSVTDAATGRTDDRDRNVVDAFWMYKDWVYNNIINSHDGVLADFVCRMFLRRNLARIERDAFFGTEARLFQQLPGLRDLLTSRRFEDEVIRMLDESVHYVARSYYVDQNGDFFARQDDVRYRNSRTKSVLEPKIPTDATAIGFVTEVQGVLFDDDGV